MVEPQKAVSPLLGFASNVIIILGGGYKLTLAIDESFVVRDTTMIITLQEPFMSVILVLLQ